MGYAGGTADSPTYRSMGDHTECFQVDFDPVVVSYDDLLELFWTSHDPTRPAWKTQYASLVLAADDEQLRLAHESAERFSAVTGRKAATRIERLDRFWLAEDYHQKYYLRNDRMLMSEFSAMFPDDDAFRESTAAAKANGFVAGDGTQQMLDQLAAKLGLGERSQAELAERFARQHRRISCSS